MAAAEQADGGQELRARVRVIAREARVQVAEIQVFWTTMFGNLDVMSRCSSAIFTAQRRAIFL